MPQSSRPPDTSRSSAAWAAGAEPHAVTTAASSATTGARAGPDDGMGSPSQALRP